MPVCEKYALAQHGLLITHLFNTAIIIQITHTEILKTETPNSISYVGLMTIVKWSVFALSDSVHIIPSPHSASESMNHRH